MQRRPTHLAAAALCLALAACGSSSPTTGSQTPATSSHTSATGSAAAATGSPSTAATQPQTTATLTPAVDELPAAERPRAGEFPAAGGRSLTQLAALVKSAGMFGAATGTFTPGVRRLAFGLTTSSGAFIYAPTAVYVASDSRSPADGPFLAAADPMTVARQYRSQQNTGPGGIKAIYATEIPIAHAGTYTVLALTRTPTGLVGSPGEIAVAASSPIPNVGQRPPAIATDTAASVHGDDALLTTRIPPEDMHEVSLRSVLGKRPVALLFSTPQLCTSRICGPVTDVAVALQHRFGNRITFIHEEVYVDNEPSKGLRPQLKAFHLETEPWLFAVNSHGVITARLEGAFGLNELTRALESALR